MDYKVDYPPAYFHESLEAIHAEFLQKEQIKQEALRSMDRLEGWCTKHKASILIDMVFELKAKTIVEIGVWGGKSLIPMAFALKGLGDGKIFGVDPWSSEESAKEMTGINKEWWSAVDHTAIYNGLLQQIHALKLENFISLVKCTSEQASPIADIDILHIDGNHSEKNSLYDVCKWVPLVKSSGFIIFDDTTWGTTTQAVKWLDLNCIKIVDFHEDNDWAIWLKP